MSSEPTSREPRLFERTLANLADAWRDISSSAARTVGRIQAEGDRHDPSDLRALLRACIEARGGEVSARGRAAELGRRYLAMDDDARLGFFKCLAEEFGCPAQSVESAIARYHEADGPAARRDAESRLRQALVPPRVTVLRQFNAVPDGTKFLVDMRAALLDFLPEYPELRPLDTDLRELLTSWFDVGFLDFQQITWQSSAALLEKLIAYEAVHEIRDWNDLRDRLDSDRRCYALFHPRMPDEPLAFIEVALTRRMASSIQHLLDDEAPADDPAEARAAIFYSISNTQRGLRQISFGDHLIKRVVGELHREFPQIATFATLSPIPGFRRWLNDLAPVTVRNLTDDEERAAICAQAGTNDPHAAFKLLVAELGSKSGGNGAAVVLQAPLMRLAARYFVARRADGTPVDPVARFHLKNGARLERINWLADVSEKGLRQAAGLMVNYRYDLDALESNHEAYMREGRILLGPEVAGLLRGWKEPDGTPVRRLAAL
jgi:malonyl-CoA decarboxylase